MAASLKQLWFSLPEWARTLLIILTTPVWGLAGILFATFVLFLAGPSVALWEGATEIREAFDRWVK